MQNIQNWQEWKLKYSVEIKHVAGFEEKFVDTVLTNISEITPNDVIPQYHFKDNNERNRYVDFMIVNKDKNYCLPIELDGYSKMVGKPDDKNSYGRNYEVFNDFLERQNSMIARFGLVLRYTNKTMLNNPQMIIQEIKQTLKQQKEDKSTKEIKERHTNQIITDYEQKIQKLSVQSKNSGDTEQLLPILRDLQSEISQLKQNQQQPTQLRSQQMQPKKSKKPFLWVAIAIVLIVIFGSMFIGNSNRMPIDDANRMPVYVELTEEEAYTLTDDELAIKQANKTARNTGNSVINGYVIDETQKVCGEVAQVKYLGDKNYLNIGHPYPNHDIVITVWLDDDLSYYQGRTVCTTGKVTEYKGKPQVSVNDLSELYESS